MKNNILLVENMIGESANKAIKKKKQSIATISKAKRVAELIISNEQSIAENVSLDQICWYNRSLIEASLDSLIIINLNGIITDVNSAFENATGILSEKLKGTDFSGYFTEPIKAQDGYKQVIEDGKVFDYELELKHISGYVTPVLYNASVYNDDEGKVIGVFVTARDITTIRKSEVELIYLKNNLELLVIQRTSELITANKELTFQNEEKEKRASELIIADKELTFQNEEKADRAAELIIADKELTFQSGEKADRAAELIIANKELVYQNYEKEKRAAELIIANKELVYQNYEKEKRAAELIIANEELAFQNEEKDKRAAELIIANKELAFQNIEKDKRAAELIIANNELAFQNIEKDKRAAELVIADKELVFQSVEKKRQSMQTDMLKEQNIVLEMQKKYWQKLANIRVLFFLI